jgi:hypothetical protein
LGLLYQLWVVGESVQSISGMMIEKKIEVPGVKPVLVPPRPSQIPGALTLD